MVKEHFWSDIGQALIEGLALLAFTGLMTSTLIVFGAVLFSIV